MSRLASSFGYRSPVLYSSTPLADDQIRAVAPSVFAEAPHESRSARYSYVPTIDVLSSLRAEGFQPFMVAQTRTRLADRREFTKHMLRLRHASQIGESGVPEVILINSHDGSSSYQMLGGYLEFVCMNGMVTGDILKEVRVRHNGDIKGEVIEGAYEVLNGFGRIRQSRDEMKAIELKPSEAELFAEAAIAVKYEEKAPVVARQVLAPRRWNDSDASLWSTFNRVQENLVQRGGLSGRSATGRRQTTRPVQGISQNVALNRALWTLAEGMKASRPRRNEANNGRPEKPGCPWSDMTKRPTVSPRALYLRELIDRAGLNQVTAARGDRHLAARHAPLREPLQGRASAATAAGRTRVGRSVEVTHRSQDHAPKQIA